jgi:hypothetical protein
MSICDYFSKYDIIKPKESKMIQLQINSPEMQDIFETKFHSNQEKFIEFIVSLIQDNKNIVDKYFHKKDKPTLKYKKLNPMENYYKISVEESTTKMTNPFKDVEDSVAYAKRLREDSYR